MTGWPRGGRGLGDERGAVTALVVVVAGLLVVATGAAVAGAQVLVAHRRAGAVADLGALAGAVAAQQGQAPCAAVLRLVERHPQAAVSGCAVTGESVRVTVTMDLGVLAGRRVAVTAQAHAGPR